MAVQAEQPSVIEENVSPLGLDAPIPQTSPRRYLSMGLSSIYLHEEDVLEDLEPILRPLRRVFSPLGKAVDRVIITPIKAAAEYVHRQRAERHSAAQ